MSSNPLVSSSRVSESGLRASLHPLVLLTISDYITRHSLRKQTQPIVGALLGQQIGREITIEHAYDVKLLAWDEEPSREHWKLDEAFFAERLQQYKDVHKAPALDLVGWWTITPTQGPGPEVLAIHRHILKTFNESSLLLAFHPESALQRTPAGGKLPLTIYESVYESTKGVEAKRDAMQIEGEGEKLEMRFKELEYEIVTDEAEMISVDFVARRGGTAVAASDSRNDRRPEKDHSKDKSKAEIGGKEKGRDKIAGEQATDVTDQQVLDPEEEESILFLSSRANAIRMLQSRILMMKSFLENLPPSYLTDSTIPVSSEGPETPHTILRAVLALTAKLPLLLPPDPESLEGERRAERSDVALVELLGGMGRSLSQAKEMGQRFAVVESQKRDGRGKGMASMAPWDHAAAAEEAPNGGLGGSLGWDAMMM